MNRIFQTFFGLTEENQLNFLKKRLKVSAIILIIGLFLPFINVEWSISLALMFVIWGWCAITTLYKIFYISNNWIIAMVMLLIYALIGYLLGIFLFIVGAIRFFQLILRRNAH